LLLIFRFHREIVESFYSIKLFAVSDNGYFINVIVLLNQIHDINSFIDYVTKIVCLPSSHASGDLVAGFAGPLFAIAKRRLHHVNR
jgi:hypothetical protein